MPKGVYVSSEISNRLARDGKSYSEIYGGRER